MSIRKRRDVKEDEELDRSLVREWGASHGKKFGLYMKISRQSLKCFTEENRGTRQSGIRHVFRCAGKNPESAFCYLTFSLCSKLFAEDGAEGGQGIMG